MNNRRKSLLFTLTADQVDSLIDDHNLARDQYIFHYVIDTFDIIKYCFPMGIEDTGEKSAYLIADQQIALDFFLKKHECNVYFFREYYEELKGLRERLMERFKSIRSISNEVQKFEEKIDWDHTANNLIGENLSLITSLLITARGGTNNFNRLFTEDHILLEDAVEKVKGMNLLELPGDENEDDKLLKIIFSQFSFVIDKSDNYYVKMYESRKNQSQSFYEFVDDKKNQEKRNAFLDAVVISRVFKLNTYYNHLFQHNKIKDKHIFIYVSSAPRSKTVIDKLYNKWPVILGKPFNVLRSDAQLFAKLILSRNPDRFNHLHTLVSSSSKAIDDELFDLIESERNRFENFNLLMQYSDFIENIQEFQYENVFSEATKEHLNTARELISDHATRLGKGIELIDQAWIRLDLFENVKRVINADSSNLQTKSYQRDPIESVKQQLPSIFDYRDIDSEHLKKALKEVSYFYCLQAPTPSQVDNFRNHVRIFLSHVKPDSNEASLVMLLFGLIVPIPEGMKSDPNTITFNHISTLLDQIPVAGSEISNGHGEATEPYFIRELKYVQVWAARRCQKYERGIRLSERYIREYPQDPRFYHSMTLIIYSWIIDYRFNRYKEKPDYTFRQAIEKAEVALKLYEDFLKEDIIEAQHGIETLNNTIAHLCARFADEQMNDRDTSLLYLNKGRVYLNSLQKELHKSEFSKYPEYVSTTALLECFECDFAMKYKTMEGDTLFQKLKYAGELLDKSVDKYYFERNKTVMRQLREKVNSMQLKVYQEQANDQR